MDVQECNLSRKCEACRINFPLGFAKKVTICRSAAPQKGMIDLWKRTPMGHFQNMLHRSSGYPPPLIFADFTILRFRCNPPPLTFQPREPGKFFGGYFQVNTIECNKKIGARSAPSKFFGTMHGNSAKILEISDSRVTPPPLIFTGLTP